MAPTIILGLLLLSCLIVSSVVDGYQAKDPVRDEFAYGTFPSDFKWGSATSAYQVEGGWNADGKGPSQWDYLTHDSFFGPKLFKNKTADVACDSYNRYVEDVKLLKNLGVKAYRFSIAWPRILPNGTRPINPKGLEYYNKLIDELLKNGIEPIVTLYHWELPLQFRFTGAWTNSSIVDHFNDFADVCYEAFGDRVKKWITINEPGILIWFMSIHWNPPATSVQQYQAAHNIILAHAKAYRTYQNKYKATQHGGVGIAVHGQWGEPMTDSQADKDAADRYMQFHIGLYAEPIYGSGDYPQVVKDLIANKSAAVGIPSRLPEFTEEEKQFVKGSADFFAFNHYFTDLVKDHDFYSEAQTPSEMSSDGNYQLLKDENWELTGFGFPVVPWGLRRCLSYIKDHYGNPDIYITENGCAVPGEATKSGEARLQDDFRVRYFNKYINEVYKAYKLDSVKVKGYFAWSLMDTFEWFLGYNMPFGIHFVNFTDPNRPRVPKKSALFYKKVVAENGFPIPRSDRPQGDEL